jgi:hypothetical protein
VPILAKNMSLTHADAKEGQMGQHNKSFIKKMYNNICKMSIFDLLGEMVESKQG